MFELYKDAFAICPRKTGRSSLNRLLKIPSSRLIDIGPGESHSIGALPSFSNIGIILEESVKHFGSGTSGPHCTKSKYKS